jgi:aspartyl-tRNA(Asn)/glutamyl-tRNA(Gln) amidotransferase subunit A
VPRRNDNLYGWNPVNFSNVGPLARDVRDAALLLQVLAGPVEGAEAGTIPTEPPDYLAATDRGVQGLRIAFSPDLGGAPVAADVAEAARTAALSFEQLGASVETVKMAEIDPVEVFRTFETVYRTRAYAVNGCLLEENRELLTDYFIEGLEGGKQFSSTDLYNAHSRMNRWRAYMRELLTGYDLLMTPSLATTAFPIGEHPAQIDGRDVPHKLWGFTPFTYPFNMSGNPAASAPAGWSAAGLPYGLQIVGRYGDEETVLAAAAAFEGASPWADSKPAMAV